MADLNSAYEATEKSQLSVTEINGPDFSVRVLVLNKTHVLVTGLIEAQGVDKALSNIASVGRFLLKPDIFDILRNQKPGVSREIQLTDPINTRAANNVVDTVNLKGRRIDFGSVDVCLDEFIHAAELITTDLYTNRF